VNKSIKLDERTDRLVTDLAYFLRSSKKSILHDAVAEFAETHHPRLLATLNAAGGAGAVEAGPGAAGETTKDGVTSREGTGSGDGFAGAGSGALAGAGAGAGALAGAGAGALAGAGAGALAGAGAGAGDVTFEVLDPWDRLALRRRELLRRFAEHGGTDVRVLDPVDEDAASDESAPTRIVLLAETDPVDGSGAVPALEEVARRVLGVHVTVVSLTALRMFGSGRVDRALAESRPL
jgi:predicted transcriptional regulator